MWLEIANFLISIPQAAASLREFNARRPLGNVNRELWRAVKESHIVTQRFCCDIVTSFIDGGVNEQLLLIGDDHPAELHNAPRYNSLCALIEAIRDPDGSPISKACYGELLRQAAVLKPKKVHAVWDLEVVKIDDVFHSDGKLKEEWGDYKDTLDRLYGAIRNREDKSRVFVFRNPKHREDIQSHRGWQTLMDWHNNLWNVRHRDRLETEVIAEMRKNCITSAIKGDFVYFQLIYWPSLYTWIIGRSKNSIGYLRHDGNRFNHTKKLCEKLR
jgi:hypothetical protein